MTLRSLEHWASAFSDTESDPPGSAPQTEGAGQNRRRVVSERTEPAHEPGGPRRFGRHEVEDAVWMAFAHANPTLAEVVRVARRRGARVELVELLKGLPSSSFAQLALHPSPSSPTGGARSMFVERQTRCSITPGVLRRAEEEPGGTAFGDPDENGSATRRKRHRERHPTMTARTMIAVDSALLVQVRGEIGEDRVAIESFVDFAVQLALEHCGARRVVAERPPDEHLRDVRCD